MAARVSHSQLHALGVTGVLGSRLDSSFSVERIEHRPTGEVAYFETDENGFITFWSHKAEKLYGFDAEEIISKHISTLYATVDLKYGKAVHELMAVEAKGACFSYGWQKKKNGQDFWSYSECQTMKDQMGNIRGYRKFVVETPRTTH